MAIVFERKPGLPPHEQGPVRGGPGLVVYLTAGDPSLDSTRAIALEAIDAGAAVIELGIPFSDPLGDGPIIQRAGERSLARGTRLEDVLRLAGEIRKARPAAGLILFGYFNPILHYGLHKFADDAAALDAVVRLARTEGILPALESAHAVAEALVLAPTLATHDILVIILSGRGDKDMGILARELKL